MSAKRSKLKIHGSGSTWWVWRVTPSGDITAWIGPYRTKEGAETALAYIAAQK